MMREQPRTKPLLDADPARWFGVVAVKPSSVDIAHRRAYILAVTFGQDESYLRDANHTLSSKHFYMLFLLEGRAAGDFVRA